MSCNSCFQSVKNIQLGIENGKEPGELKIAKVIALYKKGVKYDPNSYRRISILSLFDKILEEILCRRFISFLEHDKILYCYQYGFVKHIQLYLPWYKIPIFVDLKRALEAVDHEISLQKLECFGIWGLANDFCRSFLINRRRYTVINGVNSELRTVSWGAPQGSVLGSLFFLLYSYDLHWSIDDNSMKLYDTAIITSNPNLESALYRAKGIVYKIVSSVYCK